MERLTMFMEQKIQHGEEIGSPHVDTDLTKFTSKFH